MDDNELDKLFGEDSKSDDEALEENKAKKTGQSKEPDKSEPSGDAEDNPFVIDKDKKDSEDKEDGESDDEPDDSDETPDEEKDESEASDDAEDSEDSEGSDEDQEESDEETEDESEAEDESSDKKSAQSSPERRRRERVKPEKIRSESSIHISGKAIAAILLVIAVIALVVLIMFLPAFRVRNAHVEGNVAMTDQEVLQAVKLEYNAHLMGGVSGNIFDILRLNYGKTEERVKKEYPVIEDIKISVKLPSTVDIRVRERQKVCYIRTPDGYAALDKEGIVLELSSLDSNKKVRPVICGLNVQYAELGKPVKIANMNDYKKAIIVLGAILAADNASVGDSYQMFENTSEVRILPSGYIFLTIYSPSGHLIQIKLNSLESISDNMAWLLYAFNSDAFEKIKVKGSLDMTNDEYIFNEYN